MKSTRLKITRRRALSVVCTIAAGLLLKSLHIEAEPEHVQAVATLLDLIMAGLIP